MNFLNIINSVHNSLGYTDNNSEPITTFVKTKFFNKCIKSFMKLFKMENEPKEYIYEASMNNIMNVKNMVLDLPYPYDSLKASNSQQTTVTVYTSNCGSVTASKCGIVTASE